MLVERRIRMEESPQHLYKPRAYRHLRPGLYDNSVTRHQVARDCFWETRFACTSTIHKGRNLKMLRHCCKEAFNSKSHDSWTEITAMSSHYQEYKRYERHDDVVNKCGSK